MKKKNAGKLIPCSSPLTALRYDPELVWLGKHVDFKIWSESGIVRFSDLLVKKIGFLHLNIYDYGLVD